MMDRSTLAFFFTLFFLTTLISGVLGRSQNKSCASSSCGVLDDIHYPFRLQGDPWWCGKPEFELICESGKDAVLHNLSPTDKYLVTQISYNESSFRLVYAGYATAGSIKCVLPSAPFPLNSLFSRKLFLWFFGGYSGLMGYSSRARTYAEWLRLHLLIGRWASFMSCKQEISSDLYKPIHCLTGENNSATYVIVGDDAYAIRNLQNSCRFVNLFPVDPDYRDMDVFELLAKGVVVRWDFTPFNIFEQCWKDSWSYAYDSNTENYRIANSLFAELGLLSCIYLEERTRNYNHVIFGFTVVLVLALDIALCLLVGRFVIAPLVICAFLAYNYWKTRKPIDSVEKFLQIQQSLTPTRYAYSDIIAMTSHFREKLGQGGFGSVFKGYILGKFPVAVKMLVGSSKFHGEDFISEVSTIGRIHHINVVRLVGFCSEGSKRALIYEYMPNGSLDKYIFSADRRNNTLTVEKLHEVALGIARGIDYLHQGCDMQILHFDIKPHNILLDRNFIPKISDFGLAKLYPKDKNLISMSVTRGTIGYIAPELISRNFGIISDKSDVYSFGMLLMEMAGGRHNADVRAENTSQVYYPSWIYDKLVQQQATQSIHEIDEIVISEMERKLCTVGLWCIQIKSTSRPSMSRVVEMLEGDVNELQMPPKPFFSSLEPNLRELEFSSSGEEELHDQQHTLRSNYSGLASSSIQLSVISDLFKASSWRSDQ